jgi:hypothetical protein
MTMQMRAGITTGPGACNRWGPPPLSSYLMTEHPTSIDVGVALARLNEWVSVGFADLYRTHVEP